MDLFVRVYACLSSRTAPVLVVCLLALLSACAPAEAPRLEPLADAAPTQVQNLALHAAAEEPAIPSAPAASGTPAASPAEPEAVATPADSAPAESVPAGEPSADEAGAAEAAPEIPGLQTTAVTMRDGTKLNTDVYLPTGSDGPFPVVLARSVYGTGVGREYGMLFNMQGIAFVVQDTRGRGGSEGVDMVFEDDGWGELQDGADTVKWIHEQDWCDGTVGTFGMSALGITQVLLAPAVSDLTCQVMWVACSNFYDQLSYQGGVWRKALCEGWITEQGSVHVIDKWKNHPTYDAFWSGFNAAAQAEKVTAAGLHVGGWWDIFAQGTIENFQSRQHRGGEGAKGRQVLIMGPWIHGAVKEVGDVVLPDNFDDADLVAMSVKFFQHWLLQKETDVMDHAVHYYTMGDFSDPEAPGNEWRTAADWPPFETNETRYYLTADGGLATGEPADGDASRTFTYDPAEPCPTHGGQNLILPAGPFDQKELGERPDVLTFYTEPLEAPLEITGRVSARLYVSTDAADTDFTAKLVDVYPDGREILMLDTIRRLKFRNGYEKADPLPPGEVGELSIDLWSISLIVNKGHRIGLHVSSSNYPRFEKNPNTGADFPVEGEPMPPARNTVYMNKARPSALVLPVRP